MSSQHMLELGHEGARGRLLSLPERQSLIQVAAGVEPHRRRALALLALDQGVTQAEAGELSGLSGERVLYWRDQFRQRGLGIFPTALLHGNGSPGPPQTGLRVWSKPEIVEAPRGDAGDKTKQKEKSDSAKSAGKGKPAPKKKKKSGKKRNTKKKKSRKTKRAKQAKTGKGSKKKKAAGKKRNTKKKSEKTSTKKTKRAKEADIGRQESLNEEQDLNTDAGKELVDER